MFRSVLASGKVYKKLRINLKNRICTSVSPYPSTCIWSREV